MSTRSSTPKNKKKVVTERNTTKAAADHPRRPALQFAGTKTRK
jgi:hypothetical protein